MTTNAKKIRDERIDIRPTTEADLGDLMSLWNDGRVMKWVGFPDGLRHNQITMRKWFCSLQSNPNRHHFVIISSSLAFCGEAYYAVDPVHRRAALDIKLRPEAQGGGRARKAFSSLIVRVFESEQEIKCVWTEPVESNLASRTLYWSCGLRPEPRPSDMNDGPSFWTLSRIAWKQLCKSESNFIC
jgi:RimJ/RimL family protein N-acetyltransferase